MFNIGVELSRCGETYPNDKVLTVCAKCGGALSFRYDLVEIAERLLEMRRQLLESS